MYAHVAQEGKARYNLHVATYTAPPKLDCRVRNYQKTNSQLPLKGLCWNTFAIGTVTMATRAHVTSPLTVTMTLLGVQDCHCRQGTLLEQGIITVGCRADVRVVLIGCEQAGLFNLVHHSRKLTDFSNEEFTIGTSPSLEDECVCVRVCVCSIITN